MSGTAEKFLRPACATPLLATATVLLVCRVSRAEVPPSDGHVVSADYPIQVFYTSSAGEPKALETLGYAESAWRAQIEQMGFPPPSTEDPTGQVVEGLWVYLSPSSPTNQVDAIGDNPSTSWTDCTSRVVIQTLEPASFREMFVSYGLAVASAFAADCGESSFAHQQTAVAVTVLRWPDESVFRTSALPAFQAHPYQGFGCVFGDEDRYFYNAGSALFQLFLEEAYGDYDGKLLAAMWGYAKQEGSIVAGVPNVPNDPNIVDAMETAAGGIPFRQTFSEFARWRLFVGADHDGGHFRHGEQWTGGEVSRDRVVSISDLPVSQAAPSHPPSAFGSVYVELALDGADPRQAVRVNFLGDSSVFWRVDTILVRPDRTATIGEVLLSSSGSGARVLTGLADYSQVVLAVSNLGSGEFDPDRRDCEESGALFHYDLEFVDLPPPFSLSSVSPHEVVAGTAPHVRVAGLGFVDGMRLAFSDTGVEVGAVRWVDESHVDADLSVLADAVAGPRSLTAARPDGASALLPDAISVVPAIRVSDAGGVDTGPADTGVNPSGPSAQDQSGCGCSTPGRLSGFAWAAGAAIGLAVTCARQRHSRRRR